MPFTTDSVNTTCLNNPHTTHTTEQSQSNNDLLDISLSNSELSILLECEYHDTLEQHISDSITLENLHKFTAKQSLEIDKLGKATQAIATEFNLQMSAFFTHIDDLEFDQQSMTFDELDLLSIIDDNDFFQTDFDEFFDGSDIEYSISSTSSLESDDAHWQTFLQNLLSSDDEFNNSDSTNQTNDSELLNSKQPIVKQSFLTHKIANQTGNELCDISIERLIETDKEIHSYEQQSDAIKSQIFAFALHMIEQNSDVDTSLLTASVDSIEAREAINTLAEKAVQFAKNIVISNHFEQNITPSQLTETDAQNYVQGTVLKQNEYQKLTHLVEHFHQHIINDSLPDEIKQSLQALNTQEQLSVLQQAFTTLKTHGLVGSQSISDQLQTMMILDAHQFVCSEQKLDNVLFELSVANNKTLKPFFNFKHNQAHVHLKQNLQQHLEKFSGGWCTENVEQFAKNMQSTLKENNLSFDRFESQITAKSQLDSSTWRGIDDANIANKLVSLRRQDMLALSLEPKYRISETSSLFSSSHSTLDGEPLDRISLSSPFNLAGENYLIAYSHKTSDASNEITKTLIKCDTSKGSFTPKVIGDHLSLSHNALERLGNWFEANEAIPLQDDLSKHLISANTAKLTNQLRPDFDEIVHRYIPLSDPNSEIIVFHNEQDSNNSVIPKMEFKFKIDPNDPLTTPRLVSIENIDTGSSWVGNPHAKYGHDELINLGKLVPDLYESDDKVYDVPMDIEHTVSLSVAKMLVKQSMADSAAEAYQRAHLKPLEHLLVKV